MEERHGQKREEVGEGKWEWRVSIGMVTGINNCGDEAKARSRDQRIFSLVRESWWQRS